MIPTPRKTHPSDTLHNPRSFLLVCTCTCTRTVPNPGASPLPKYSWPKLSADRAPEKPEIDTGISPRRVSCSPANPEPLYSNIAPTNPRHSPWPNPAPPRSRGGDPASYSHTL